MPRNDAKGRSKTGGRFAMLPLSVLKHPAVTTLEPAARWVLVAMAGQFSGGNNGALALPRTVAREYGVRSADTLKRSLEILCQRGLIEQTHSGSYVPPTAAQYALCWQPINQTQWTRGARTATHAYRLQTWTRATRAPRNARPTRGPRPGRIPKTNCAARSADPLGPPTGPAGPHGDPLKAPFGSAHRTDFGPTRVRPPDTSRYLPDGAPFLPNQTKRISPHE